MKSIELIERLKIELIDYLKLKSPDKPYLKYGHHYYTPAELVKAIQEKEIIGDYIIQLVLSLTIDLIDRGKIKI